MKYLLFGAVALGVVYADVQGLEGDQTDPANCAIPEGQPGYGDYTVLNDNCWVVADAQTCFNKLGNLQATETNTFTNSEGEDVEYLGSIYNECSVQDGDQKVYDFTITIESGYDHDLSCVAHSLYFVDYETELIEQELTAGNGPRDEYLWTKSGQTITFSVDHEDLVDVYNCKYTEETEQYTWDCLVYFDIIYSDEVQYRYIFHMESILPRETDATLDVTIERNQVTGDCCTNTLSIESSLHFCEDLDCTGGFDDSDNTFERREHFFVAHIIDTAEFRHYELQGLDIFIGPFLPKIHAQQRKFVTNPNGNTSHGGYVYELESFAAFENLTISATSKIDDTDFVETFDDVLGARRLLEEADNYRIKAESSKISVVSASKAEAAAADDDDDNSTVLSVGFAILIAFFLI